MIRWSYIATVIGIGVVTAVGAGWGARENITLTMNVLISAFLFLVGVGFVFGGMCIYEEWMHWKQQVNPDNEGDLNPPHPWSGPPQEDVDRITGKS